ncbi:ParB/RepB/Spo0J family partition protein [Patescibacteria group bacterium]|nr:ParB/RepB/Spo0J family partition protein [Patescibacteria group bacterium]MDE1946543.1 ParB/RepB/Spo0J family partition protein [Patescibacteria group bacterium]MDE2010896.1 ParB/RepB/Spo0J family partition protein [Patescibacteria group bacterium]MDE2232780.1 ParB/RepB/Spo0J family partition protein [Patescibacteria group bacterium]
MTTQYVNNAIFWIELEKISPNPYQPRREFDEAAMKSLAESIRMYGVLQPLVVTRKEVFNETGGMSVEYELISGERRLRAAKLAGLAQVPALIRNGEDGAREKLEIAIIENLQREDLNAVERARSFNRLIKEFGLKQTQVADKVGKSREYVANTLRILALPDDILTALEEGKISEGHTRPLLMLSEKPEEQAVLFKEIMAKKLSVREAEAAARRVATERVRNKEKYLDPAVLELEKKLNEALGTRVKVDRTNETGGIIKIDFFSTDDLRILLSRLNGETAGALPTAAGTPTENLIGGVRSDYRGESAAEEGEAPADDRSTREIKEEENEDIYSLKNFSV